MRHGLVKAARLCLLALYTLFSALPKRRRLVCLSRESDTPPLDFLLIKRCVADTHPDYDVLILAKQVRFPLAYGLHMIRQLYAIATGSAVLLDTYAPVVSLLAGHIRIPVIQMWHAVGNMKKFGYTALGDSEGRSRRAASLLNMHQGYTSVLISSMSFVDDYAAGFNVDPAIITEAPLPRTDLLTDPKNRAHQRAVIQGRFPELARRKNIVYCPTFRKQAPANQAEALASLVDAIDFSRYNLILKAHPLDDIRFDDPRVMQDYDPRINMLFVADYVISDYSTVIYEAGLADVPVFLYAYDWADYSSRRSLYIDPARDVPTLFTGDARALIAAIEHDDFDRDRYREFIRRNVTLPEHGTCTEQVVRHVFDLMARTKGGGNGLGQTAATATT